MIKRPGKPHIRFISDAWQYWPSVYGAIKNDAIPIVRRMQARDFCDRLNWRAKNYSPERLRAQSEHEFNNNRRTRHKN